ncbi:alpha-amylase family glycosyl hydrolase [Consotaella sp. CSK11QG-6]
MIARETDWWRGATIYQIYPRSFMDKNGDGLGDLAGIAERLPLVASLGVDAIWISPFFASPMRDFGYDISDHTAVDPIFGTLDDFDAVVTVAHDLGLKVLIDQVLCHTSDIHPWFVESRTGRIGPKADWYVWADPKADGSPPNNWLSLFGGPAWTFAPERGQYYLHKFLPQQPALNLAEAAVEAAVMDISRFWLARGVDGFRLDSVNFYHHDQSLRDNPARSARERAAIMARPKGEDGIPRINPYNLQRHVSDKSRPETVDFLRRYRHMIEQAGGETTIAEIAADDAFEILEQYTRAGAGLHMGYTFDVLSAPFDKAGLQGVLESAYATIRQGWPCWAFSNHDVVRVQSRWGPPGAENGEAFARMIFALLTSLRGSVCLYQGEELGLLEADIAFADLQDPYGRHFWPAYKGRDGCRTPMPWRAADPHAGFGSAEPWLPIPPQHRARAFDAQDQNPNSVLSANRRFLRWRKSQPALVAGSIEFRDFGDDTVAFERRHGDDAVVALFNLVDRPVTVAPGLSPIDGHGFAFDTLGEALQLPPTAPFSGDRHDRPDGNLAVRSSPCGGQQYRRRGSLRRRPNRRR